MKGEEAAHGRLAKVNGSNILLVAQRRALVRSGVALERNVRLFNPHRPGKYWKTRVHQAASDMKAHIESMVRRFAPQHKTKPQDHVAWL